MSADETDGSAPIEDTVSLGLGRAGGHPDAPEGHSPAAGSTTPEAPGRYVAEGVVGEGGWGRVLAVKDRHLGRSVARKELRPELEESSTLGRAYLERFLREARVTASLEHPGVVPVYELGTGGDGRHYFTMKHVQGRTLAAAIQAASTQADRLALLGHFVDLCNAVAYAHSRSVIHRDLKPANVVLGEFGETVLLDWGLARLADASDLAKPETVPGPQAAGRTLIGEVLGTPAYMAPEQARGESAQVDARADVWGLGAILYELISGQRPVQGDSAEEVLAQVGRGELESLAQAAPSTPPELVAIVQRAMAFDPADRYPTAEGLAREVDAWRTGRLVSAYEYSAREFVARFVARQRVPLAIAAIAFVLLLVLMGTSAWRIGEEIERAQAAEGEAKDQAMAATVALASALEDRAARELDRGRRGVAQAWLAESLRLHETTSARGLWTSLRSAWHPTLAWTARFSGPCRVAQAAVDTDGRTVACVVDAGRVEVLDGPNGEVQADLPAYGGHVRAVAVSAARRLVATQIEMGQAGVFGFDEPAAISTLAFERGGSPMTVRAASFSPSGTLLAMVSDGGHAWVGAPDDLGTGLRLGPPEGGTAFDVAFDPGARRLAVAGRHALTVWDIATGERIGEAPMHDTPLSVGWLGDGQPVLGTDEGPVEVWDAALEAGRALPAGHEGLVWDVDGSADGRWVASAGSDGLILLQDAGGQGSIARMFGHAGEVITVGFGPEGLVSVGADGLARGWSLADHDTIFALDGLVVGQTASPTIAGDRLFVPTRGGLDAYDLGTGRLLQRLGGDLQGLYATSASPSGRSVIANDERRALVWSLDDAGHASGTPRTVGDVSAVDFSPDGTRMAVIDRHRDRVRIIDPDGTEPWSFDPSPDVANRAGRAMIGVRWLSDSVVAVWGYHGALDLLDASSGEHLARHQLGPVASGDNDWAPRPTVDRASGLRVLDDAGVLHSVHLGGQTTRPLQYQHTIGEARALALQESAALLAVGDVNGTVVLIDNSGAGPELARRFAHGGAIRWLRFVGETVLLSYGADERLAVWDLSDLRVPGADLADATERAFGLRVDADGKLARGLVAGASGEKAADGSLPADSWGQPAHRPPDPR